MSNNQGPYFSIDQQNAAGNPYESWREEILGTAHGRHWATKFSPSWPAKFNDISPGNVSDSTVIMARDVSQPDASVDAKLREFAAEQEAKKTQRMVTELLGSNSRARATRTDANPGILEQFRK